MLRPNGIYLLDLESEAFLWIGKDVKKSFVVDCYKLAIQAMNNLHCTGCIRLRVATLNLVFYGYEPQMFRAAFKHGWNPFEPPSSTIQINEEDEFGAESDGEGETLGKDDPMDKLLGQKAIKQMKDKLPASCWLN